MPPLHFPILIAFDALLPSPSIPISFISSVALTLRFFVKKWGI